MDAPELHVVYRAFDGAGQLLYVGCTSEPKVRVAAHRTSAPWYPQAARWTYEPHPDRKAALAAEAAAIRAERPLHNVRMRITAEQEALIEAVREAQRERERGLAAARSEMRQALAYAVTLKVPVSVLAEELGVGRDTVYRHLGRES
jgi:predicted GIY-YIG superfamily endonuclease